MQITPDQLTAIYFKASTLLERHGGALTVGRIPDTLSIRQIMTWDNALTDQSGSHLAKRLSWFEGQEKEISAGVARFRKELNEGAGWAGMLKDILLSYPERPVELPAKRGQNRRPEPFEELLVPFTAHALTLLRVKSNLPGSLISGEALAGHAHSLLRRLARISASCFYEAFAAFREGERPSGHVAIADENDRRVYMKFVRHMYAGGLVHFFTEYSVLARLVILTIYTWVRSTALLLERLSGDLEEISGAIFNKKHSDALSHIRSGVTGTHSLDGEVCLLTFASGGKVVYKPRSAATDCALERIVTWLNETGALLPMQTVTVIDKGRYSWHEFVRYQGCKNEGQVRQYYQCIGQFAGLLQLLGSTDYHFDNIRACGPHPFLIDNETLFSPILSIDEHYSLTGDTNLDMGIVHAIGRSLFLTDTRRMFYPEAPSLAGVFEDEDRHRAVRYVRINRDTMYRKSGYRKRTGRNIPKVNGKKVDPMKYVKEIKRGYIGILELLNTHKTGFEQVVREATQNYTLRVRLLLRPTAFYEQIVYRQLQVQYMRDGVDRSLLFEELLPFYMHSQAGKEACRLASLEIAQLESQLVPWFDIDMRKRLMESAVSPRASLVRMSALEVFQRNLDLLSSSFIENELDVTTHYFPRGLVERQGVSARGTFEDVVRDTATHLQFCYRRFYPLDRLSKMASDDTPALLRRYALGDGIGGILLIFAAMHKVYTDRKWLPVIEDFLLPLRECIENDEADARQMAIGCGGLNGLGSVIYGLTVLGGLLEDDELYDLALHLATSRPVEPASENGDLSLGSGLAGNLISLIKLSELRPDQRLDAAIRGILKQFFSSGMSDRGLTGGAGYFNGDTGILYAMCRAWQYNVDPDLHMWIADLYKEQEGYWNVEMAGTGQVKDRRDRLALSEGLAGWFMVQPLALKTLGIAEEPGNLEMSIPELLRIHSDDADHVAGGLAGRCEPVMLYGNTAGESLEKFAKEWHERFLRNKYHSLNPRYLCPFFCEGTAGVLYQQMRLCHEDLPSVIAFE